MMWIFALFSAMGLFTVLLILIVMRGREEYREGMVLGVHIPEDAVESSAVQALLCKSRRRWNLFQYTNLVLSLAAAVPFLFCGFGTATLLWCFWLLSYVVLTQAFLIMPHRALYALKQCSGWVGDESSKKVYIDTALSAQKAGAPHRAWIHGAILLLFLLSGAVCYLFRERMDGTGGRVLYGALFSASLLFLLLDLALFAGRRVVYSENSEVNATVCRMTERLGSLGMQGASLCNLFTWLYLMTALLIRTWIGLADIVMLCLLETSGAAILLVCLLQIPRRRQAILARDDAPVLVDDDIYWKNGWYSNPHDKSLLVQNRLSPANYTFNMARPAARLIVGGVIVLTAAILTVGIALCFSLSDVTITLERNGPEVSVHALMYTTRFNISDIESVRLIDALPDDEYLRTNGAQTGAYAVGYFKGRETGVCELYLYDGVSPVIELRLDGRMVYLCGTDEAQTREWYALIGE